LHASGYYVAAGFEMVRHPESTIASWPFAIGAQQLALSFHSL
jgi:hypothetical protein